MRIDMNVPFAEKDEAKALGARWDGLKKCWYIVDMEDLNPFLKWFPEYLTKPYSNMPGQGKKRKKAKPMQRQYTKMHKENMKHMASI